MIYKLSLLGWNPYEIADVVSISRQRVEQILGKDSKNLTKVKNLLLQDFNNKPIEKIAEYHGFDLQTTWAIVLDRYFLLISNLPS